MSLNKEDDLRQLAYDLFNGPKGKKLLSLLVDQILFSNAYNANVNLTYMNLGKQELVLELLHASQVPLAEIKKKVEYYNSKEMSL